MSVRQSIKDALKTRMQGITVANGYSADLGSAVDVGRTTPYPDSTARALNIIDTGCEPMQQNHTHPFLWGLQLLLDITVQAGSATEATVLALIADVYKAIGTDPTFNGLAKFTMQPGDTLKREQEATIIGGAEIKLTIVFTADQWTQ